MSQIAILFVTTGLLVSPVFLCAKSTPIATIMVRLYSEVQLAPRTLGQAEQESVRIFRQAGIEIDWVECGTFMRPADPRCKISPDPEHLVMRIVRKASSAADSVFGMAFLSETDGRGAYGDVFFGSVERLHQECGVSVGRVLGYVMAHELGHLMLGTKAHTAMGIMQPHWSSEQLRAISQGSLLFTPEQATLMRKRLRSA
jgi:hypothetical protein